MRDGGIGDGMSLIDAFRFNDHLPVVEQGCVPSNREACEDGVWVCQRVVGGQ